MPRIHLGRAKVTHKYKKGNKVRVQPLNSTEDVAQAIKILDNTIKKSK